MRAESFATAFNPRHNALNFIRISLASLVLVSHSFPIGGFGPDPQWHGLKLGTSAVGGFFIISGYLITRSRERKGWWPYTWARAARILPGLWVCVLVTAFVIAPAISTINGGWSLEGALRYLPANMSLLGGVNSVGTVLNGNPLSAGINGSLWTLPYEVACYVAVGVAVGVAVLWRHRVLVLLGYVALLLFSTVVLWANPGATGGIHNLAFLAPFFAAGAVMYRFSDVIPYRRSFAVLALILLVAVVAAGYGTMWASAPLAYLLMWSSIALPEVFKKFGRTHDLSYGLYVYAFPIQQFVAALDVQRFGVLAFIAAAAVLTTIFSALSWVLVERPAQRIPVPFARVGRHRVM